MATAMKLDSSNPPVYLPEKEQTTVLRLGFEHCAPDRWIFPVYDLGTFFRHKSELANSLGTECHDQSDGSARAQREFHGFLLQHLKSNTELGYRMTDNRLIHEAEGVEWEVGEENLWRASLWVPEDICLLEKSASGYRMTAASVCSPSNWILREKIGQSIDSIHEPVPAYQTVLGQRVNRFLDGMRSGKIMLRYNWSVQPGNELFWRDDLAPDRIEDNAVAQNLYWRIERQTFIRLPTSGAIVFGIRIFLHSFASLRETEGFEQTVAQLLNQLPDAEKRYKGIDA